MIFAASLMGFKAEHLSKLASTLPKAGVEGVELCASDFFEDVTAATSADREAVRALLRKADLPVVGLGGLFAGHPALGPLGGEDTRRQSVAWAREHIRLCDELGARRLILGAAPGRNMRGTLRPAEAMALLVEWIEGLLPLLESREVTLILDTLPPEESDFLGRLADVREVLAQVRHPLVRMGLDARAFAASGENINVLMDEHLPYVGYVRAVEPNLGLPGDCASLPHMMLGSALGSGGFHGPLVVAVQPKYLVPGPALNTAMRRFAAWYGLSNNNNLVS